MKTLIICFSQTGNTQKIAECICDGVIDITGQCDIKPLGEIDSGDLDDYDLIGLGSPVFYYKEPFHVEDFIQALPERNGQHWFVFCTHANVIGSFFPSVVEKLKNKEAMVIGCHNSYANLTVPYYPKPSYTSGHPDQHDLKEARAFGRNMAELSLRVKNQKIGANNISYPISSEEWAEEGKHLTREFLANVLPKLALNTDTCVQCHECEKNCPVQGIDIEANPPHLQDPCIYCWRCVNICPTLSIHTDWEPLVRMAPDNYIRYKKELDKAATRGEFRWLVDPETIDLNNPLYKQRANKRKQKQKAADE